MLPVNRQGAASNAPIGVDGAVMSRYHPLSRWRVAASAAAATVGMCVATLFTASPASASGWIPYCGPSGSYVEKIEVSSDGASNFIVHVTPTSLARQDSAVRFAADLSSRDVVVEQWHAIQGCKTDLEGDVADSIWQQLECHQRLSWAYDPRTHDWFTGPTYDLESYRPPLPVNLFVTQIASGCGKYLGVDPGTTFSNPMQPDAGITDLEHAFSSIA